MPVVTRALGSDNLGIYSYTYSIALYGTYFILLGLNQYGNREIAKVRDDKRLISKTFWVDLFWSVRYRLYRHINISFILRILGRRL